MVHYDSSRHAAPEYGKNAVRFCCSNEIRTFVCLECLFVLDLERETVMPISAVPPCNIFPCMGALAFPECPSIRMKDI